MAAFELYAGFVAKLGNGTGFNLYLFFFFLGAESFHSSKQKMVYIWKLAKLRLDGKQWFLVSPSY